MTSRSSDSGRGDAGFTLIELVVVIIIGILWAIAISTFLKQREKAWDKAASSDLRNNVVKMDEHAGDSSSGELPTPTVTAGDYAFKTQSRHNATVVEAAGLTGFRLGRLHRDLPGQRRALRQPHRHGVAHGRRRHRLLVPARPPRRSCTARSGPTRAEPMKNLCVDR